MLFEESYKSVLCPAKINLHLAVGPRRRDGYHDVGTLMAKLDWGDSLDLEIRQNSQTKIQLRCSDESIPMTENLVYKAAKAFSESIPVYFEAGISLKKKVPPETGLAGGSSDAATVLLLLKDWYLKRIGSHARLDQKLEGIADSLGSDLRFFLNRKTNAAWCSGRGEKLRPMELASREVLLLFPRSRVSTKRAYQLLDEKRKSMKFSSTHLDFPPALKGLSASEVWPVFNDFQAPIFEVYPDIQEALTALCRSGALFGGMSGSGSCVYGVYRDSASQGKAYFQLTKESWDPVSTRIEVPARQSS